MSDPNHQDRAKTRPVEAPDSSNNLARLYVVAHLHWERENWESFETRRARLLDIVAELYEELEAVETSSDPGNGLRAILLGGQTILLEDMVTLRPDLISRLLVYNAGGRLTIGPWYIAPDEALVSGESLIRNLLAGRADGTKHGLRLAATAYVPDTGGHIAQLPQIFNDFAINATFLQHGAPVAHLPFRWDAPDGSSVLTINHIHAMRWPPEPEDTFDILSNLQAQKAIRPEGPFLWMYDVVKEQQPLSELLTEIGERASAPVQNADAGGFVRALRHEMPDAMRPALKGELRLQTLREHVYLLPGTLSSRIYLKQRNSHLQTLLAGHVETLLTIALSHGEMTTPHNARALLAHCWRLLLKNQGRSTLGGAASDDVHEESEIRARQVEDISRDLINRALTALPGTPSGDATESVASGMADKTYLMLWNTHNWPVEEVTDLSLRIPSGRYPARLLDPNGDEQIFGWEDTPDGGVLSLLAEVPALGYAAYTVELSNAPPSERHLKRRAPAQDPANPTIASADGATLSIKDGRLSWRFRGQSIDNLLTFYDGGDAGDIFNYSPPEPDVIVEAALVEDVQIESSPLYERLIMRHRMRIAPALNDERGRERGLKLMELTTTATLYDHKPGVFFNTTFENTANDHRLRAHLRTTIKAESVRAASPFYVVRRQIEPGGPAFPPDNTPNTEGISGTQPLDGVVSVDDGSAAFSLLARDLPEYEAIHEDDQVTLALTLVRAVGWLSRGDLGTRTAPIAPEIAVPGAQCQRVISADYALVPLPPGDPAALMSTGRAYQMPLLARQYAAIPERATRSYFSVVSDRAIGDQSDGDGIIVTAFKPPQAGDGWIVRFFNPHSEPVEVYLTPHQHPTTVQRMTMSEDLIGFLEPDVNGRVSMTVEPGEIVTLGIVFTLD